MDYYILLVFVAGFAAGVKFGDKAKIPKAEKLGSALAVILLFVTGLSLGNSWFSNAFYGVLPLSLAMAVLAMALSLLVSELFWRNIR